MTVQSVCLGWHWQPYAYSRTADDTDGAPVKPLPPDLAELARRAVADTYGADERRSSPTPPSSTSTRPVPGSGLHQDGEEPSAAPVVTISLGDTCVFRMAGVDRRTGPFTDVELRSGDLLVFGGRNRRIYHGVPKVLDGTGPAGLDLPPGPAEHHGARDRAWHDRGSRDDHRPGSRPRSSRSSQRARRRSVMRVCRAMLGPADAEDAWSETFLAALRAYPELRSGQQRARLAGDDRPQSRRRRPAGPRAGGRSRPIGARPEPDAPHAIDAADGHDALRAALDALAPKQRTAVVYRHLGELPYPEIARAMGTSETAARRNVSDGIAKLRTRLREDRP